MQNIYAATDDSQVAVISLGESARARFIARTYLHLLGAIAAFVLIEVAIFANEPLSLAIAEPLLSGSWLIVLGAFMLVSWLFTSMAFRARSLAVQYLALAGFVVAEALIFVPLLYLAMYYAPEGTVESAAVVTLGGFLALTLAAFWVRKDFSFLGAALRFVGLFAVGLIVASIGFGFELGTWFSAGMVAFAGAAVLFDTSKVLRGYPEDRYVGAALSLFASIALMFWYVLQLFMSRD